MTSVEIPTNLTHTITEQKVEGRYAAALIRFQGGDDGFACWAVSVSASASDPEGKVNLPVFHADRQFETPVAAIGWAADVVEQLDVRYVALLEAVVAIRELIPEE